MDCLTEVSLSAINSAPVLLRSSRPLSTCIAFDRGQISFIVLLNYTNVICNSSASPVEEDDVSWLSIGWGNDLIASFEEFNSIWAINKPVRILSGNKR
jgi:hypothetical protein